MLPACPFRFTVTGSEIDNIIPGCLPLVVSMFRCVSCDKSFSRSDAVARHKRESCPSRLVRSSTSASAGLFASTRIVEDSPERLLTASTVVYCPFCDDYVLQDLHPTHKRRHERLAEMPPPRKKHKPPSNLPIGMTVLRH